MEHWGEANWTARDLRCVPVWRVVACTVVIEVLLFLLGVEIRLWWEV